ncbi:MAG: hypothetical protein SFT81_07905 [Candidatus Caenarcaniphilales bacterium]|nr:hypothetical protein [Candidatus Caenarcaniphilales bacterium]
MKVNNLFFGSAISSLQGATLSDMVRRLPSHKDIIHSIVERNLGLSCKSTTPGEKEAHNLISKELQKNLEKLNLEDLNLWHKTFTKGFDDCGTNDELDSIVKLIQAHKDSIDPSIFDKLKAKFPQYSDLFQEKTHRIDPPEELKPHAFKQETSKSAQSIESRLRQEDLNLQPKTPDACSIDNPASCACCEEETIYEGEKAGSALQEIPHKPKADPFTVSSLVFGGIGVVLLGLLTNPRNIVMGKIYFSYKDDPYLQKLPNLSIPPGFASQSESLFHDEDS